MAFRHDAANASPIRAPDRLVGSQVDERGEIEVENEIGRTTTHLLTMLSVAAGMVGVCLTANGLIGIARPLTKEETLCDDILAVNSLVYLAVAGLCFAALRTPLRRHAAKIAVAGDVTFCVGLTLTTAACFLLARFVVH